MNFFARNKKIKGDDSRSSVFGLGFLQEKSREVMRFLLTFARALAQISEKLFSYFSRPASRMFPKVTMLLLLALGPVGFRFVHAMTWNLLPDMNLIIAKLFNIPIVFGGWILGLAGLLLNTVLDYTVVNMSGNLAQITGINIAWATIRDLSNMSFIFILLYISISTVLGLSGSQWKKTLGTVVIAAVLLNFSLFMTKVMIDASNIFTLGIYRQIVNDPSTMKGLSDSIMEPLGLTTLYKVLDPNSLKDSEWSKLFIISFGSTLFMLVTAGVFVAAAVMFLIRYITIIFLLIFSPIAVMGLLPQFSGTAKKWWDQLMGQLIFAPAYMIMTWIVITIIKSSEFVCKGTAMSEIMSNLEGASTTTTYAIGAASCAQGSIGAILNFVIVIAMAVASLTISRGLSNQSDGMAQKLVGGALGFGAALGAAGGRRLIGRDAKKAMDDPEYIKKRADQIKNGGILTRNFAKLDRGLTKRAAEGNFDVRAPLRAVEKVTGAQFGISDTLYEKRGVTQISADKGKKKDEETAALAEKTRSAEAKIAIRDGIAASDNPEYIAAQEAAKAAALPGGIPLTPAQQAVIARHSPAIEVMERSINRMTSKEVEAIVSGNRKLLENQEFANNISVQQLEAIDKSDKFTEQEKEKIKSKRFSVISDIRTDTYPNAAGVPDKATAFKNARGQIRGLSKKEIEMLPPELIADRDFVAQLSNDQVKGISDSDKFIRSQKDSVKDAKISPLFESLEWGATTYDAAAARKIIASTSAEDLAKLANPPPGKPAVLTNEAIFPSLNISKLKGLAVKVDDVAVLAQIRSSIITAATAPTTTTGYTTAEQAKVIALKDWLELKDEGKEFGV